MQSFLAESYWTFKERGKFLSIAANRKYNFRTCSIHVEYQINWSPNKTLKQMIRYHWPRRVKNFDLKLLGFTAKETRFKTKSDFNPRLHHEAMNERGSWTRCRIGQDWHKAKEDTYQRTHVAEMTRRDTCLCNSTTLSRESAMLRCVWTMEISLRQIKRQRHI